MNFSFFASFIGFSLIIYTLIRRQNKQRNTKDQSFWERERESNFVRRKSLEHLNYISIPLEQFPTHLLRENEKVQEYIEIIANLTSQKIVNFTGLTNTDLKLEYGTANITALTEYDQNYIVLARTLQKWADALIDAGYMKDATTLMEFAVSTNTDVSSTYYHLADYWIAEGETAQVERLIQTAEGLHSANQKIIVKNLREKLADNILSFPSKES